MHRMPSNSTLTLTHPTAGPGATPLVLPLPENLLWVDEYGWSAVKTAKTYTTTGALWVDSWAKQAGRPITLQGAQDRAWCDRGALETLRAWAADISLYPTALPANPAALLSLNHRGTVYPVMFDHDQPAIAAEPLTDLLQGGQSRYTVRNAAGQVVTDVDVDYFDPQPTDPFAVTLRLIAL